MLLLVLVVFGGRVVFCGGLGIVGLGIVGGGVFVLGIVVVGDVVGYVVVGGGGDCVGSGGFADGGVVIGVGCCGGMFLSVLKKVNQFLSMIFSGIGNSSSIDEAFG